MESFDQHIADALADKHSDESAGEPSHLLNATPARVLLVAGEHLDRRALQQALGQRHHPLAHAMTLGEARSMIARARFDVIVLETALSDGDGLDLAPLIQKTSPATKIIVLSDSLSIQNAIRAMRCGAVDFLCLPAGAEELARRVEAAVIKSRVERQREDRIVRLKKICQELNTARHEISKQVDVLCADLVNAYQDIADQMSDVSMASEFRTLLKQELDVEDLLRTTLEYMLTKTGPTNAAVFLPDGEKHYGLGAYVNYDCPRETVSTMLDHLCDAVCPQLADEPEIVSFEDAAEFSEWIGMESAILAESEVIAFSCRHKDRCLAVIVLFRSAASPFDEKLGDVIETLRGIIAEQLHNVIRVHHRAAPSWPRDAEDGDFDYNDDPGFGFEGGLAA